MSSASPIKALLCSFVLLPSVSHAVPIEFRMEFEVQEAGFDHPVGTTAFVSAIYDSDPPRVPPLLPGDTSDWYQGESLSMGVGGEVFATPVKPSMNVYPSLLRIEDTEGETIIFVVRSDETILSHGLPASESDLDLGHDDLFYFARANFGGGVPLTILNKERGFELVGVSVGPVPEPSGSLLLLFGAVGFFVLRHRDALDCAGDLL